MIYFLFILLMFWLGAESGASFPWSKKWQQGYGVDLGKLPELVASILLGFIAMQGYQNLGLTADFHIETGIFLAVVAIIYAGIQSATWMFVAWTKDGTPNTARNSDLKPIVDWLAEKCGWKLGDEGYSWVAAAIKGTVITLPMGGLGGLLFALGYEIGSHARGRVDKWFNPHIIAEGMSFVGVGIYVLLFLKFTKILGSS